MSHLTTGEQANRGPDRSLKYFALLSLASLVACFIARAPSTLDKIKIPIIDLEMHLNAGYLVVFGSFVILCAIATFIYLTKNALPSFTRAYGIVRVIPCLAAAFLSLQFFLLLAPQGQCSTFSRWRYLTDWTISAFQPEYCMGLPNETQRHMPWLGPPVILEAWAEIMFPLLAIGLIIRGWSAVRRL